MLVFSDWVPDQATLPVKGTPNLKSMIGRGVIGIICLYVFVNLWIMGVEVAAQKKAWIRKVKIKRMEKRCAQLRESIAKRNQERL